MALLGEDPSGESPYQFEAVLVGVDQDEFVDRQHVTQSREPVDEFRRVRRPATDDSELHPLTPVNVTPSMKALWAKKNTMITGAITSNVAAIVRFQFV